jgi:hypothetical protein
MESVILVLALPLSAFALWLTFGAPRQPHAAGPPAVPARAGVIRRVLPWLFAVGIFVGAFLLLPAIHFGDNLVRLIALSRYGLLTGLVLVGLVPLGLQAAPSLLANLFVLRSPRHLFHVAWLAVVVGSTAVVLCRVEEFNAPSRYGTDVLPVPDGARDWVRVAAVLVVCLPVPLACGRCSRGAFLPAADWRWGPWVVAGLVGVAFGFLLVVLVAAVQPVLLSPDVRTPDLFPLQPVGEWLWRRAGSPRTGLLYPAADWLARVLDSPGYTAQGRDGEPHMAPGHLQAAVGIAIVLAVYTGYYLAVKAFGVRVLRATQVPALFLLLVLLLLLGFFLQGAAFALDRYWVPAVLAVALFAYAVYQFSHTDHLFSLGGTPASGGVKAAPAAPRGRPADRPAGRPQAHGPCLS